MSGTSLDGVDIAYITLSYDINGWSYTIHEADTISYSLEWVNILKEAVNYTAGTLNNLDDKYTLLLAGIVNDFIAKNEIKNIDAICSHGHTILHQPEQGITLQIGNLPKLAELTGETVVCNFRKQDVELGGQGAPLVPIGDRLLFNSYDFCLNLGGFSNISFEAGNNRIAYDICPVNTVLNYYAAKLDYSYDDSGKIAASGKIIPGLMAILNELNYYKASYPKSLGVEFVRDVILPIIEKCTDTIKDKLCTFTEHIAMQIAKSVTRDNKAYASLLITGGGTYNTFLIERIKSFLPHVTITLPDDKTIQYKEALIFALLGVLKLRGEVNVLSSVTGSPYDHSSGVIIRPK